MRVTFLERGHEALPRTLVLSLSYGAAKFRVDDSAGSGADRCACGAGERGYSELEEYDALINTVDFISILKLKARL